MLFPVRAAGASRSAMLFPGGGRISPRDERARNGAEANAARRDGLTDPGKKADTIITDGRDKNAGNGGKG